MKSETITNSNSQILPNPKIKALEKTIEETSICFKDLILEFDLLYLKLEKYRSESILQREKCESQTCASSETLKKLLELKENTLNYVGASLTKFNNTKKFEIITDIMKVLCGESTLMTPPKVSQDNISTKSSPKIKMEITSDVSSKQESLYEIEGTPTGCKSPILQSRKILCNATVRAEEIGEKKKSPNDWSTPNKKTMKLECPTPNINQSSAKMKQTRLSWVNVKPTMTVDLTCSPFGENANLITSSPNTNADVLENDTIQPSPTSGSSQYPMLFSNIPKGNKKSRKLSTKLKIKMKTPSTRNKQNRVENAREQSPTNDVANDITSLSSPIKYTSLKCHNDDETYCSPSITACTRKTCEDKSMQQAKAINTKRKEMDAQNIHTLSPVKKPLAENINISNIDYQETSMSLLAANAQNIPSFMERNMVIKKRELVEPIYKEPTVRKKCEKRQLPGWSCDECKNFYNELYKHNPEMLAKKMSECSKHRGKNNPIRPKTPPGFWNPRWDVPENTEEFNKRNDAV